MARISGRDERSADGATHQEGRGASLPHCATTSPTLADQIRVLLKKFPAAHWHRFEPTGAFSARAAAQLAFGEPVNTYYRLADADVILSLDADFLCAGPASVRYARDFADRRRVRGEETAMNRLYVVEAAPSPTGAKADHHLPLRATDIEAFAAAMAGVVGVADAPAVSPHATWIAVVKDLREHAAQVSSFPAIINRPPCTPGACHQRCAWATPARP